MGVDIEVLGTEDVPIKILKGQTIIHKIGTTVER